MNRRTIIKQISILTGAAFVGGELILQTGCKSEKTLKALSLFNNEQITLLDEIGDIIIPTTDTPGAKAVQIGSFINKIATDCYSKNEQGILVKGIEKMKLDFEKKFSAIALGGYRGQKPRCHILINNRARMIARAELVLDIWL